MCQANAQKINSKSTRTCCSSISYSLDWIGAPPHRTSLPVVIAFKRTCDNVSNADHAPNCYIITRCCHYYRRN